MAFFCPIRIRSRRDKLSHDDMSVPGATSTSAQSGLPGGAAVRRMTGSAEALPSDTTQPADAAEKVGVAAAANDSTGKMVVLHDFTPCVDDELEVKRGQIVHVLYQENDWVYVVADGTRREGFIPHSYCTPFASPMAALAMNIKKKMTSPMDAAKQSGGISGGGGGQLQMATLPFNSATSTAAAAVGISHSSPVKHPTLLNGLDLSQTGSASTRTPSSANATSSTLPPLTSSHGLPQPMPYSTTHGGSSYPVDVATLRHLNDSGQCSPFIKTEMGRYVVLYKFEAASENDLAVDVGQIVTLLNVDDPDWSWVRLSGVRHGESVVIGEGFVPSAYIYPLDVIQRHHLRTQATSITSKPTTIETGRISVQNNGWPTYENQTERQHCRTDFNNSINATTVLSGGKSVHVNYPSHGQHARRSLHVESVYPVASDDSNVGRWGAGNGHVLTSEATKRLRQSGHQKGHHQPHHHRVRHHSGGHHTTVLEQIRAGVFSPTTALSLGAAASDGVVAATAVTARPKSNICSGVTATDLRSEAALATSSGDWRAQPPSHPPPPPQMSDLVVLYDYKSGDSNNADDLCVQRGDWLKADLDRQPVADWLWAFSQRQQRFGFVPRAYAKPPAMTSL